MDNDSTIENWLSALPGDKTWTTTSEHFDDDLYKYLSKHAKNSKKKDEEVEEYDTESEFIGINCTPETRDIAKLYELFCPLCGAVMDAQLRSQNIEGDTVQFCSYLVMNKYCDCPSFEVSDIL